MDGTVLEAAQASLLAAHDDPFSGLPITSQDASRKLELYQQLLYLLKSRREYLRHLFSHLDSQDENSDTARDLIKRVVSSLLSQPVPDKALFLDLIKCCIHDHISNADSIDAVLRGYPTFLDVALCYLRPEKDLYSAKILSPILRELLATVDLDLEVDPVVIHRRKMERNRHHDNTSGDTQRTVSLLEAIMDPQTRGVYIDHLQLLKFWTQRYVEDIIGSTANVAYSIRCLSREIVQSLQHKFPDASKGLYAQCIARLVYHRFIGPAMIVPGPDFDIVLRDADRNNVVQIYKIVTNIANGELFEEVGPRAPLNEFVQEAIDKMRSWLFTVADAHDVETEYRAHNLENAPSEPIWICPNDIYMLHSMLLQTQDTLNSEGDPLKAILSELGHAPDVENDSDELKEARDALICLELTDLRSNA